MGLPYHTAETFAKAVGILHDYGYVPCNGECTNHFVRTDTQWRWHAVIVCEDRHAKIIESKEQL